MAEERGTANDTVASSAGDFFCDLCKLEFTTKEELQEHSWTMLHHGKLNKAKGRDCVHECTLCEETFVELLSFTKHLHADTHQERYHTWKKQQRSSPVVWQTLDQLRSPSPVVASGQTFYPNRNSTRRYRKNSNGKSVSFRTRHQHQKNVKGGQHHRKRKGSRNTRHFREDGNSFQFKPLRVDNPEMGQERDLSIMSDSMGSIDQFGRNSRGSMRTESPFFGHEQYYNYDPQTQDRFPPQIPSADTPKISRDSSDTTGHGHQPFTLNSSWTNPLRQAKRQFSENTTELKDSEDSFSRRSQRIRKRDFLESRDRSVLFLDEVGDKESNGNSCSRNASSVTGVSSRTCNSDNKTSQAEKSCDEQTRDSDIYSGFVSDKGRNSFGSRQNRTRYFRNRTWVSDALKSRKGNSLSQALPEGKSDRSKNSEGVAVRSGALSNRTIENQPQFDSFESFKSASFKGNERENSDVSGDREPGKNTQESCGVRRSRNSSIGGKNADQRAFFTFSFPDPTEGNPEDSKTEVIMNERIPLNDEPPRTRRNHDSDNTMNKSPGETLKNFSGSKLPNVGLEVQSKTRNILKSGSHFQGNSSVTETSSLRRTSPRLRRLDHVTQSQNSEMSSVVGSSVITNNSSINVEQKQNKLGMNSKVDEEVEMLNALIKMKKEPSDPLENAEATDNSDTGKIQSEPESTNPTGEASVTDSQTKCNFVHIDGVHCEALTSERYCSYHQRFPQGNLIKTEPGAEHEQAVPTSLVLNETSLSPCVLTRDVPSEKDSTRGADVKGNHEMTTRRDSQSLEGIGHRSTDNEHSNVSSVIKSRRNSHGYDSIPNRQLMQSSVYLQGNEHVSERTKSQRDTMAPSTNNVQMMDLSMSTNLLVLPHSQVVTSTNVKPTITNRTTSSWQNGRVHSWKEPPSSGYWTLPSSGTVLVSSSSSTSQQREKVAPKWSSNSSIKAELPERRADIPVSPASTPPPPPPPPSTEPRKSSVSPVIASVHKDSNISPSSGSSVPSLDLSRLNLPPHVRRALALKYATKKQSEGAAVATSHAPNLSASRNRFVEAKKSPASQEKTETTLKETDTALCKPLITSNVIRGRLRQQRSISLDSCPTSRNIPPEVSNSYGRLSSLAPYERFPTVMSATSGFHSSRISLARASNVDPNRDNFSGQKPKMIDLSASNYIPSLQRSGAPKERQHYKDRETTAPHFEHQEFVATSEGEAFDTDKVRNQHKIASLENITSYASSSRRSVRAASVERFSDYPRFDAGGTHVSQPSRVVAEAGFKAKEDRYVSGAHTSTSAPPAISNTIKKESEPKVETVHHTLPRPLLVTPPPSEGNRESVSLESDARTKRPREGKDHKETDGAYIALEAKPRSATPERSSTDLVRLRQYGLVDLGSTAPSIRNGYLNRDVASQDRHAVSSDSRKLDLNPSPADMIFPAVSQFRIAESRDIASSKRKPAEMSDDEERNKRRKGLDFATTNTGPLPYLPGVEVQELLHLEHEEQKQLKALQDVQAKAKATRLKLQSLSIELEHLNVLEKRLSDEISSTKNRRLEILQSALRGGKNKTGLQTSASEAVGSQFQKNNAMDTRGLSSAMQSDSTRTHSLDHEAGLTQTERVIEDKTVSNCQETNPGNMGVVVKTENEEPAFPSMDASFSLNKCTPLEDLQSTTQVMTGGKETSTAVQSDPNGSDQLDVSCDPALSKPGVPQEALVKEATPSSETPTNAGMSKDSEALSQDKEEWVSGHFEKSRKEFFMKIKQQLSTPKKRQLNKKQRKRFSETKVSNSLATSKERLQLVRDRMRGWKEQADTLEFSNAFPRKPSEQEAAVDSADTDVDFSAASSASAVCKDTNLTPSKIPVRDVGDSSQEKTNELKTASNYNSKNTNELKVKLKSKIGHKKKRKSSNPSKKTSSRPDIQDQPQTVTQKEKTKNTKTDERVQHTSSIVDEPINKKLERKAKASKSLSTPKARAAFFEGHTGAVCALKVSQGKLFTCSADKTTKAFDIQTGECVKNYQGHHQAVNCLEISSNGERLFTGSNDQTVRSYDIKTGVCSHKFTFDGRVMCLHIGFGILYVGLSSGVVTLVDLTTNTCVERLRCHEPRAVSCLATATEGQRTLLCTGSFDATISIRDHKTGLLFKTLTSHSMTVLCMQVVDNVIYSGAADGNVLAHNLNTGELIRSYCGHTLSISSLQVVGRVLVTSCLDKLIRCYDLMSAELLQAYGGQSDMIFSVHLSNGRIYSGTRDGKVSSFKLDLRVYHPCKWKDCQLNFGIVSHMKDHIKDFHIIQQGTIDKCLWAGCAHIFGESDNIETILDHVDGHLKSSKTDP